MDARPNTRPIFHRGGNILQPATYLTCKGIVRREPYLCICASAHLRKRKGKGPPTNNREKNTTKT